MSFINEEREQIIRENNSAQSVLLDFIKDLRPDLVELNINTPLQGEVDLSVCKFSKLRTIVFGEGNITDILNIPDQITKLVCPRNLLVGLSDLPNGLVYLDCDDNYISSIDLSKTPFLQELHCENNKIVEFETLPKSLVNLYCGQNKLKHIDLKDMKELRILHISNNPLVIIENLPDTIHEFLSENNSIPVGRDDDDAGDGKGDIERKINYDDALTRYFKLKTKYEEDVLDKKRAAYQRGVNRKDRATRVAAVRPKCIHCKRPVGSIFATDVNGYTAICGDTSKPCKLDIKLSRGNFEMDEIILNTFRDSMNDTKDRIIKLKMDTLFNYVSEAASGKIFTRKIDEYNKDSKIYKDELDKHNELYNNPHTQELIKTKTETIHELNRSIRGMLSEYTTTDNKNILTTVIETYKNDLLPEVENLRRLKYDIMEMNHIIVEGRPPVSMLFQSEVAMSKREYVYGEKPSVLKFVVVNDR